ncbi:MAG TPA: sodium-dependent transporter [Acidobacteriota bacterium]|nr:sodium-dependent transporter [Acidobacteriota bacterium]
MATNGNQRRPDAAAERETFSSGWGMIFALLGVSIGLGNFWRFPYMMGIFGGGAFLAIYLLIVVVVGVPALLAELMLGRATGRGPVEAFVRAGVPAGRQIGQLLFVGVAMAMTYYLVVLGWLLAYLVMSLGWALGLNEISSASFAALHARWPVQMLCSAIVAGAAATVVTRGVRSGIERISSVFLPVFGVLTLGLVAWSLSLPGAGEGFRYLFTFDWRALTPLAVMAAVGQAYFSLGLGGTFLVIYGSYLPADAPLPRRAISTAVGDVAASILAALIVIPVAFAYGLSPATGPPLLFEVMPAAFVAMPAGPVFGVAFFLGLLCIAFLSGVAAIEVLVGSLADSRGWSRGRSAWVISTLLVLAGLPAMLSLDYIVWSDLLWGSTMQPVGSVAAVVALAWGLGRSSVRQQLTRSGSCPWWVSAWFFWVRYVVPAAVLVALLSGWLG